jgi:hypothetical protein
LSGGIAGKERAVAVNDEGFERTIGLRSAVAINMTQMTEIEIRFRRCSWRPGLAKIAHARTRRAFR